MLAVQKWMKEKVLQSRRPDTGAVRPYDDELVPAVADVKTHAGVKWAAYNRTVAWIPDVSALSAVANGIAKIPVSNAFDFSKKGLLHFDGYLKVPRDGNYTFYLTANEGAFLRIHNATVIDEDFGYVGGTERGGTIRLKAGLHPFRLYYSSKQGSKAVLDFKWEGEGIAKQVIPASAFHY
jgi:hypothetical protein